ncbi:type IV pilus assembly protein FimV [Roseateles sp. PN1]|uniref:type IV pilus assembly protein FimV n=1 Tax=Roseateles sp. PN1 TaxID=3137372 RepID=UPI0031387BF7
MALLTVMATGAMGSAAALGVERPSAQSALGQSLNLAFPVRLGPNESLSLDCVQVEVFVGEARLSPAQVRVQLEGLTEGSVSAVRVRSFVPVNEPIVNVTLSLGCPVRLVRQYSALIDPPDSKAAQAPPVEAEVSQLRRLSPALQAALANVSSAASAAPAAGQTAAVNAPGQPTSGQAQSARKRELESQASAQAERSAGAAKQKNSKAGNKDAAKLRLDAPELDQQSLANAVLDRAAVAAAAASSAAEMSAALQRLQAVESGLAAMRRERQATEAKLQSLRSQLAPARTPNEPGSLTIILGVAVLALSGAVAFLWHSRRRERVLHERAWWHEGGGPAGAAVIASKTAAAPSPVSVDSPSGSPASATAAEPALVPAAAATATATPNSTPTPPLDGAKPVDEQTIVLPYQLASDALASATETLPDEELELEFLPSDLPPTQSASASAPVPQSAQHLNEDLTWHTGNSPVGASLDSHVSVELLIDLEQQVDFFLVLGQTESAVELLQERIRTGAASALPYLKLMEIHQSHGQQAEFAAVAQSFAERFGAVAPTWGDDVNHGRELADYPDALRLLQLQWSDSGASMACLQQLLSEGNLGTTGFDLPAYRELLFLYSVARDLSEHEVRSDDIDLFLPLDADATGAAGMDLMATMVWQAPQAAPTNEPGVDILLDDPAPRKI